MTYQPMLSVDISLQTSALSRAGFGTPIFASANNYFLERVRAYTSLTAAADDMPTDSNTYKALTAFFSQSPSPTVVKVGRLEADEVITPVDVAEGSIHGFVIKINDTSETSLTLSYTVAALEDAEDVVDAFVTAITGDANISAKVTATKVGSGPAATLSLTRVAPGDNFSITNLVKVSGASTVTETAASASAALAAEDDDWYFMTCEDHSQAWVVAMAAAIEATKKIYFFSSQETGTLSTIASPATDTIGKIYESQYLRTVGVWSDTADTTFPECSLVGFNAPYDAGSVTWANLQLNGVAVAKDPSTGLKLSTTQLGNIYARNASTTEQIAGLSVLRGGTVAKGNFIDDIRGSDDLDVTMTTSVQRLLINQQGSKLPYTDTGINQINATMQSDLQRFVDRGFLESYTVSTPRRAEVNPNDIANRQYTVATFQADVAGAIHNVVIRGILKV